MARKTAVVALGAAFVVAGVVVWQNLLTPPVTSYAASPDSCFDFNAGTGTISSYYYNEGDDYQNPECPMAVDIPQTIGGVAVTAIGNYSFWYRNITSVTIPNSVTTIGSNAFANNQLTSLIIPNGVTSINEGAFYSNQLTSVNIPNSVTNIGRIAFYDNQLTSVTIPSSVMTIGDLAFLENDITSFSLLGTPTSIGSKAIAHNPIVSITHNGTVYSTNQPVLPIPTQCFDYTSGTLTGYHYMDLGLIVSSGIACFSTAVDIPQNLGGVAITAIGNYAFNDKQLTAVTIPSSVTYLGNCAFCGNQLTSVIIPSSVTSMGEGAFSGNQLTSVIIPSSLTSIGLHAFSYNQLTSVTIPSGVTSIGNYAFYSNQLASVVIPGGVTSIGDGVFNSNQLTSIAIPSGVTSIGWGAFSTNKLASVTIPSGVTSIGNYAFYSNQLASVTIPSGVTSIGDGAFESNNLTSIILLGTPSSIGSDVIKQNLIASITHNGTTYLASQPVLPIPTQCFEQDNGTLTDYHYMDLALVVNSDIACMSTAVDIPQSLGGDTITSIGTDAFSNKQLTSVTFPGSVTSISWNAFYGNNISHLVIPDTVTTIEARAFKANQLTSLTLGCGVTSINQELFAVNKLTEVTIPDCITSIDPTAFFGQNPWGGIVDQEIDPAHDWWSADQSVLQLVHDNLWYARLYTSDPTNPHHLVDGVTDESWYIGGDLNGDGDQADSIGGHLINPASLSVQYVDESHNSLATGYQLIGRLTNGTNLTDYLVKNVQTPGFVDAQYPTTDEQAALETALSQYYQSGQNIPLTAPSIPGYVLQTPASPYSAHLTGGNNTVNFTYAPPAAISTTAPDKVTIAPSVKPSTQPSATATNNDSPAPVPDEPRTKVDFTAPAGSAANPTTEAVPSGLAPIMTKSNLTIDDSKPCHQIDSAKLLSATSFTAPDTTYKALGGLAFLLTCTSAGGDASVTFTLGDTIADVTKVKVYKRDTHGVSTDITSKISLTNHTASGRTTISYNLQDGQSFDDDGAINSSISDPIYITVPSGIVVAVTPSASTQATSPSTALMIGSSIAVLAAAIVGITITIKRRKL